MWDLLRPNSKYRCGPEKKNLVGSPTHSPLHTPTPTWSEGGNRLKLYKRETNRKDVALISSCNQSVGSFPRTLLPPRK